MLQNDTNFINWTTEDFEWKLNGSPFTFKAGSVTPMTQGEFDHFAKHLTARELNKSGFHTNDQLKREEYLRRCQVTTAEEPAHIYTDIPNVAIDVDNVQTTATSQEVEFEELTKEEPKKKSWCDTCDAKGPIKHKKSCPKFK